MGAEKKASLFYRDLDEPRAIKSVGREIKKPGNPDFFDEKNQTGNSEIHQLDAARLREPRFLTSIFNPNSNPETAYRNVISGLDQQAETEPTGFTTTPEGRAFVASEVLKRLSNTFGDVPEDFEPTKGDIFDLYNYDKKRENFDAVGGDSLLKRTDAITTEYKDEEEKEKAAALKALEKVAFIAWGGGELGLHPKGRGVGGALGYTNALGLLPIPYGSLDIGGPEYGMQLGVTPDSDGGVSPLIGARLGHPRASGLTRQFPRGLPEVIYDKLRGRTKQDAIRASYPDLEKDRAERAEKKKAKKSPKAGDTAKAEKREERMNKEKTAGWKSEMVSGANPLNLLAAPFAGAAALSTPTQSYDQLAQRLSKDDLLQNLKTMLVPGVGPYQSFKTVGTAIRSPELNKLREEYRASKKDKPEEEKEAGWKSEILGSLAPPNLLTHFGTMGGSTAAGQLAALGTPTRSLKEQAQHDEDDHLKNAIPGYSAYNTMKRMGTSIRSPELLALIEKHKAANKEGDKPKAEEEKKDVSKEAMFIVEKVATYRRRRSMNKAAIDRAIKGIVIVRAIEKAAELNTKHVTKGNTAAAGALLGGGLGAGAGALQALIQRSLSKKDEEDQPSIINRALLGGIAGSGAGAAGGYLGAPALKQLAGNPLIGIM